jgi:hypothetical protein
MKMGIEVQVDAEAVNKMVTDAILESAIGKTLREVVEKKVADLGRSYNNPIELAVDREVQVLVSSMVNEKFKPLIAERVNELVTEELVTRIAGAAWDSLIAQLDRLRR